MNHVFDPTQEQELIINKCKTLQKGEKLRVAAFAGAGKTSTIILIADALSKQYRKGIYLAFNKGIAEEAKSKLPNHVEARTFHSLASVSYTHLDVYKRQEVRTLRGFVYPLDI